MIEHYACASASWGLGFKACTDALASADGTPGKENSIKPSEGNAAEKQSSAKLRGLLGLSAWQRRGRVVLSPAVAAARACTQLAGCIQLALTLLFLVQGWAAMQCRTFCEH